MQLPFCYKVPSNLAATCFSHSRIGRCCGHIFSHCPHAIQLPAFPNLSLIHILDSRPEFLEVVLTGRNPDEGILERADYISEIQKRRHPYDRGLGAREGIEY